MTNEVEPNFIETDSVGYGVWMIRLRNSLFSVELDWEGNECQAYLC